MGASIWPWIFKLEFSEPHTLMGLVPQASLPDPDSNSRFIFQCRFCGRKLSAHRQQAGMTGPCPSCGKPVNAIDSRMPVALPSETSGLGPATLTSSGALRGSSNRETRRFSDRSKGRIAADTVVDQRYQTNKEARKTLVVIMMFILAICACLWVSWFLTNWIKK